MEYSKDDGVWPRDGKDLPRIIFGGNESLVQNDFFSGDEIFCCCCGAR